MQFDRLFHLIKIKVYYFCQDYVMPSVCMSVCLYVCMFVHLLATLCVCRQGTHLFLDHKDMKTGKLQQ